MKKIIIYTFALAASVFVSLTGSAEQCRQFRLLRGK